jgi:periplasmic mercuric ion binding protein
MKAILAFFLLFAPIALFADNGIISSKFIVKGNCGECKERIEEAAYAVKGVKKAVWDKKTKEMTVVFNSSKTNIDVIKKAIVAVGHDIENQIAKNEVYNKLPGCCAYRTKACHE